jgi:hypothetical protein
MSRNGSKKAKDAGAPKFVVETVSIGSLKDHPKNYREHPDDQLEHLQESLREHGFYRNIVVARDGTILAGHGMVKAAKKSGLTSVPVIRLDVDPADPKALKVLIGDNEIEHLAEQNDRLLTELLGQIKDSDPDGLLGTGYDGMMLANLLLVTRSRSEMENFDEAASWVGLPEYEGAEPPFMRVVVSFRTKEAAEAFFAKVGAEMPDEGGVRSKSMWYPPEEGMDRKSIRFQATEAPS